MKIFDQLSESRNWTWKEVGEHTLDQLVHMLSGDQNIDPAEYDEVVKMIEEIEAREAKMKGT